jgi:hypothetical protein
MRISAQRKEAVQAFWAAYFASGDKPTEIQFDGTGMLTDTDRGCLGGKR